MWGTSWSAFGGDAKFEFGEADSLSYVSSHRRTRHARLQFRGSINYSTSTRVERRTSNTADGIHTSNDAHRYFSNTPLKG
jgi:hypothetical protein